MNCRARFSSPVRSAGGRDRGPGLGRGHAGWGKRRAWAEARDRCAGEGSGSCVCVCGGGGLRTGALDGSLQESWAAGDRTLSHGSVSTGSGGGGAHGVCPRPHCKPKTNHFPSHFSTFQEWNRSSSKVCPLLTSILDPLEAAGIT